MIYLRLLKINDEKLQSVVTLQDEDFQAYLKFMEEWYF